MNVNEQEKKKNNCEKERIQWNDSSTSQSE